MRKYLALLTIIIIVISGCEKDDFCTQTPVTPSLVLRFYDKNDNTKTKNVERLSIIAQSKTDSLLINKTLDSVAIPLNPLAKKTIYTLKVNTNDGATANNQFATLTILYTPEEEFVSRSCGYRVIFNNVTLQKTGWLHSISISTIPTINNQNNAHVKIYH